MVVILAECGVFFRNSTIYMVPSLLNFDGDINLPYIQLQCLTIWRRDLIIIRMRLQDHTLPVYKHPNIPVFCQREEEQTARQTMSLHNAQISFELISDQAHNHLTLKSAVGP